MQVTPITVGPFQENCYLLMDDSSGQAVLIDPGDEGPRLLREVERAAARLDAIWITHAHVDHIGAVAAVRAVWNVPIFLHPLEEPLYRAAAMQAAHYGLPFELPPPADRTLSEGDVLHVGSLRFDVLHVPGHAPGHVAFVGEGVLFAGDCLFAGSVGRTDLPLSQPAALARSLERLAALPGDTVVYAGHGSSTTIAEELRSNPFLNGLARIVGR